MGEKRRAWEWAGKEDREKSLRGMVGKKQMGVWKMQVTEHPSFANSQGL